MSAAGAIVVVDTDALSFVLKEDPVRGPRYEAHLVGRRVVLTFAVVAELRLWAEERGLGPRRRAAIDAYVRSSLVLYPDDRLCTVWAEVVAEARRNGRAIHSHDAWNAAFALFLRAPLVTHNTRHYAGVPSLVLLTEGD